MGIGTILDENGNAFIMQWDGIQHNLFLKLKHDGILRKIGRVHGGVYYKSENKDGVFRALNAFGFCHDAILHSAPEGVAVYYQGERYYISKERFDNVKIFLDWKKVGFEHRCYIPLHFFKRSRQ